MDPGSEAKEQRDVNPKLQYPFSFRGFPTTEQSGNGSCKDLSNRGAFEIHKISRDGWNRSDVVVTCWDRTPLV